MNFGTPVPLLVGIILILFSIFLFFLEKFKPGYKRDADVIYASFCLAAGILNLVDLSGGFLHSAQSVIFTGLFISLALESINGRVPDNSPKSMGMPLRDDDRSPRSYRAGFEDNFSSMDDRNSGRQMGGGSRRGRDEFDSRPSGRMESGRSDSGRGDSGRADAGRSDRDRFLEDRPRRRSSSRDDEPMSPDSGRGGGRRDRDEFGDDVGPRSIPERTSASDMDRSNVGRSRGASGGNTPDGSDDVPRPRRRPDDEPRRGRPPSDSSSQAPASDYLEFSPVEPITPKEYWGPKE
ncbi:MAG: Ycf66 family protein [Alkalinema sp. CAN_BIN05]|nr:Ycf66 family protein [Alkalinema sp. CAN_BIN05]